MDHAEQLRGFARSMKPSGLGGPGQSLSWARAKDLDAAAAEIERLRAAPRVPAQWNGLITLECETYINGIRYAPGTYGTKIYSLASQSDEILF